MNNFINHLFITKNNKKNFVFLEQRQIQSNQEKQVSILGMPPYSLGTCSESEDCTVSEDTCDPCHETLFQKLKRLYCKFQRCSDTKKIVVGGTAFAGGWLVFSFISLYKSFK